ncbi:hypothetical protein U0035_16330 [Niabella yanshanensis]|uniref:Uncharacterized protein n=1 Tax=Niabella yanshanensis TaxID=577386 RepID=A0ABZ0W1Z6_9BACT|nr:hypothetical protein [Niabella yanshanensis]WQD37237.1 hypothetical protein U0035_16330 [Niabella yanshanensis]
MQLYISEGTRPEDVKNFFSSCYPFLKIELYKIGNENNPGRFKKLSPVTDKFVDLPGEGIVDIHSDITVAELGNSFASLGLRTEVFRKSGNVWVATLLTDSWTLQQQNNAGEEITNNT